MIRFDPTKEYNSSQLRQIATDLKSDVKTWEDEIKRLVSNGHSNHCCSDLPNAKERLKQIQNEQMLVGQKL